jgi:hypothetical protein
LDLEPNHHSPKKETKDNLENGRKYVKIIKTPYQNLMLNRQVLKIGEKPIGHRLFLPQEVVRCEVWISGLQKRHSYK